MTKRELSEDEKKICERALIEIAEQMKALDYNKRQQTMTIEEGLELQYKQNLKIMSAKLAETENEIANLNEHIKILNDQLQNGVEIKEEKPMEEKTDGTATS